MVMLKNVFAHPNVMVSSTYSDLAEHREAVIDALLRLGFFPIGMEFDSSKAGSDVIDSSLEFVNQAHAYVGIISHRYGGVPKDDARNPDDLSITELEYRRALDRRIPVYMFLMSGDHPVKANDVEKVEAYQIKLQALKDDARSRSICSQFSSVGELKSLVLQSMADLKSKLERPARKARSARGGRKSERESARISPPDLLAIPDFISGHEFVGRRAELSLIDTWAASDESMMVIEAIGGAGKSALAWQWIKERAREVRPDLVGVMWYSFYEGGADMAAFAAYALAYTTGQPLKKLRGRKTADLARELIVALHERPFLLVLDGLERVLVAYHRLDASQVLDDQVPSDKDHRACIKPADGELLRQLVAAAPSKILITSRLMPTALTNNAGKRLPTVRPHLLAGMDSDDALAMMRGLGIRGSDATIRRYLKENFDNHPLLLGIVAGLVNDYIRDPGNFDRWAEDPQGGADLRLSTLNLSQRRTHILAAALNGLEPGSRQLLSRIAAFADAVPYETVAALNPFMPSPPNESRDALSKLVSGLQDLERRGLLQWDRRKNSYDMHPVIRGYAFDILDEAEQADICNLIVNHFESKPRDKYAEARTLADVQQSINMFRALVQAGRVKEAADFYMGDFSAALLHSVEAHHDILALLRPLFPDGFQNPPRLSNHSIQSYLMNEAAFALFWLSRISEARTIFTITLGLDLKRQHHLNLHASLTNLGIAYLSENRITQSFITFEAALQLAKARGNTQDIAKANLDLMGIYRIVGFFEQSEAAYDEFRRFPVPTTRAIYRPGYGEEQFCWLRLYQGMLTDKLIDWAEALAQTGNNRKVMRSIYRLRGELELQRDNFPLAINAFEQAIEMAQAVGLPVSDLEARLALAKARAGEIEQAREICDRLQELAEPPHPDLATAYLEIGDRERARYHALKGYPWAWAEGPLYSLWWELKQCQSVLNALGEPEPAMPAFDPKTAEPIPYEKEIRKFIAKLNRERKKREKESAS